MPRRKKRTWIRFLVALIIISGVIVFFGVGLQTMFSGLELNMEEGDQWFNYISRTDVGGNIVNIETATSIFTFDFGNPVAGTGCIGGSVITVKKDGQLVDTLDESDMCFPATSGNPPRLRKGYGDNGQVYENHLPDGISGVNVVFNSVTQITQNPKTQNLQQIKVIYPDNYVTVDIDTPEDIEILEGVPIDINVNINSNYDSLDGTLYLEVGVPTILGDVTTLEQIPISVPLGQSTDTISFTPQGSTDHLNLKAWVSLGKSKSSFTSNNNNYLWVIDYNNPPEMATGTLGSDPFAGKVSGLEREIQFLDSNNVIIIGNYGEVSTSVQVQENPDLPNNTTTEGQDNSTEQDDNDSQDTGGSTETGGENNSNNESDGTSNTGSDGSSATQPESSRDNLLIVLVIVFIILLIGAGLWGYFRFR